MTTYEPSLFDLEDRGYNNGVGSAILPDGTVVAVAQNDDEMARALVGEWWEAWQEEIRVVRSDLLNDDKPTQEYTNQ